MKRCIVLVAVVVLGVGIVSPVCAQLSEYETVLLPIATGRHTSLGLVSEIEFTVYNDSSIDLEPNGFMPDIFPLSNGCFFPACPSIEKLRAKEARQPLLFLRTGGLPNPGILLHVKRPFLNDLWFNLRLLDTSRQELNWGTEIPVVREADFRTTKIVLLNVPLDSRFRQALRVYDPDSRTTSTVRLRIFPMSPSPAPLVETTLTLQRPSSENCSYLQELCYPSSAEVQDFPGTFPELQGRETVRVEIESLTPGLRFWSFITITNNETQEVTTITPQSPRQLPQAVRKRGVKRSEF